MRKIGSLTVLGGIIAILVLPRSASKAYFLTEEEKTLAYHRIAANSSVGKCSINLACATLN